MMARNGLIGMCPCGSKQGDVIVIFNGGKVPFVLCRLDHSLDINGGECNMNLRVSVM
jgi:hypothetical protein